MYDDDDTFLDPDAESTEAQLYATKGQSDRADVDQQAKDYDALKKKKRDTLTALEQKRLVLQSKLSNKEHELHALTLDKNRDAYLDTRERVQEARAQEVADKPLTREEEGDRDVADIAVRNDKDELARKEEQLHEEIGALKTEVNEAARAISLLQHELLQS